jgi:MFS family permease
VTARQRAGRITGVDREAVGVDAVADDHAGADDGSEHADVQRRTLRVLVCTQVLGGIGVSIGLAVSTLAAARMSGSDAVGGSALTCFVIGAAIAALLLARIAGRSGRRPSLSSGYLIGGVGGLVAVAAAQVGSWQLLLAGLVLLGGATAAGLAARFAATDLAAPQRQARALATVVWATTVGAVAGPNLGEPAQRLAGAIGFAPLAGPFLFCVLVFGLAAAISWFGLRPDPLRLARAASAGPTGTPGPPVPGRSAWAALRAAPAARLGVAGIVLGHLVMVGLMSMTPVHMGHSGATLQLVGLVISLHVAGMYALSPVFGWLADRIGSRPVLGLGALLLMAAGGVGSIASGHQTALLAVGLILLGLGWSAGLVAGSALVTSAVPVADRTAVQGLADVAMNVAGAVGGIAAGLTVAGSSFAVLGIGAAVLALPFLIAVALARPVPGFIPR